MWVGSKQICGGPFALTLTQRSALLISSHDQRNWSWEGLECELRHCCKRKDMLITSSTEEIIIICVQHDNFTYSFLLIFLLWKFKNFYFEHGKCAVCVHPSGGHDSVRHWHCQCCFNFMFTRPFPCLKLLVLWYTISEVYQSMFRMETSLLAGMKVEHREDRGIRFASGTGLKLCSM